ncbi:hypothetical protein [Streptomyces platensis]|uniref:hypothetical protein n=1 Tax=Streptomyces platensis TaxID=58346 RepID=UPI001F23CE70|nr:hypothetical protein [Streptomyces platensis]MCF3146733.1 hypothetical protein [Streptomyces platensis]
MIVKPARSAAVALLALTALGLAAPTAAARVDPDPMVAGQRVSISDGRRCAQDGAARVSSRLFGPVVLRPGEGGGMGARARVAQGAAPGRYPVTIHCASGGASFTETVTVRDGRVEGLNAVQAAGGLALLALAAGAAFWLRRTVGGRS